MPDIQIDGKDYRSDNLAGLDREVYWRARNADFTTEQLAEIGRAGAKLLKRLQTIETEKNQRRMRAAQSYRVKRMPKRG